MTNETQQAWYENVYARRSEAIHTYKLKLLEIAAPSLANSSILDVGCGTGQMAQRLNALGAQVVGVDFSLNGLRHAAAYAAALQTNLDQSLPFANEQFDAVWCTEVIEHVISPLHLLQELHRILRPGGRLFLTTPNSAFHFFRYLELFGKTSSEIQHPGHLHFFSARSLARVCTNSGFQIEQFFGRAVFLAMPTFGLARRSASSHPTRLEGLLYEDTLMRGPLLLWTRFIRLQKSFWADTFIMVAHKVTTGAGGEPDTPECSATV